MVSVSFKKAKKKVKKYSGYSSAKNVAKGSKNFGKALVKGDMKVAIGQLAAIGSDTGGMVTGGAIRSDGPVESSILGMAGLAVEDGKVSKAERGQGGPSDAAKAILTAQRDEDARNLAASEERKKRRRGRLARTYTKSPNTPTTLGRAQLLGV